MAKCYVKVQSMIPVWERTRFMELLSAIQKCVEENKAGMWEVSDAFIYLDEYKGLEDTAYIECYGGKDSCIEFARRIKNCLAEKHGYEPDREFEVYVNCL